MLANFVHYLDSHAGLSSMRFVFFLSTMWQRFLLQQPGIEVHAKDDRGNTALDAARENDKLEVVQVLEEFSRSSS